MCKTVITSSGNNLDSQFDRRFGRAAWYCVYDEVSHESIFIENENLNANHGAGTKAAEQMIEMKVQKIISGDFGPKAKELLDKFNVQMVIIQDENSFIKDIITKIKS